jgi:predicted Zn-dependent peptidase
MRALTINDLSLKSEREVVKEERRFRVDNDIGGMVDEQLEALAFVAHPYHWPVIGWMGDLDTISRPQCEDYFRTYYAPNNAVLFVVGDFDPETTFALIEKAYGDIPAGPPVPPVAVYEPAQNGERRAQVRYPAQSPMLSMGYKAVEASHPDAAALDVIQAVLSIGEGARLERTLVRQKEVATSVAAFFEWRHDPGLFKVILELAPGGKPAKALDALDAELEKLKTTPLTDVELSRAKNILRGQTLRGLGTNNGKAHAFGEHELLFGSWKDLFGTLDRYERVTAADVQRAARTYLDSARRSIVELVPTSADGADTTP